MIETLQLSEEFTCGPARLRVDIHGSTQLEHVLEDMNFLNYRLAEVHIAASVTQPEADLVWHQDGEQSVSYDGRRMTFTGAWNSGPIQKVIVTLLALRLEEHGLHPFHASAVRYRGRTILFMGASRTTASRWARSRPAARREARVHRDDRDRRIGHGDPRVEGAVPQEATRAPSARTRPRPRRAGRQVLRRHADWEIHADPTPVDVVVLPAIDGNFAPSLAEMIPFERQFQTLHSLQNYFLLNELLAPGHPMPMVDTESLRKARAGFVERFAERPYYFVRAATPQVLLDEVERVI